MQKYMVKQQLVHHQCLFHILIHDYIDGKKSLLFGPFAGFSPKFLKTGSNMDLITSVKPHNLLTLLAAGAKEMDLTKYLVQQLMLSKEATYGRIT